MSPADPRVVIEELIQEIRTTAVAREGWWWGHALKPLDRRAVLVADGSDCRLEGEKRFCSGSHDARNVQALGAWSLNGQLPEPDVYL